MGLRAQTPPRRCRSCSSIHLRNKQESRRVDWNELTVQQASHMHSWARSEQSGEAVCLT